MATISTSQDWDSAARSAGETITINSGAVLTINTDTRYHKNAPASGTGSLGIITMTAATGGRLLIDGTAVWWIAYDGLQGAPNVPAYDTVIAGVGSGAYGNLLGFYTTVASAPTAVGAAVPATGFIKLKSKTGTFIDDEILEIQGSTDLCTANGIGARGWIEVIMDEAAGTIINVGRAQAFEINSDWFYLDDTTGAAQIFQLPTCGGGAATYYPGLWVETSPASGTYEFYPAQRYAASLASGWYSTAKGTDARSKFCEMQDGGALRIGANTSGAYGYIPDSGCKVRIPNVILNGCLAASRASNNLTTTIANRPEFQTTSSGNIDINGALCNWYVNLSQSYSVDIRNTAIMDNPVIAETATQIKMYDSGTGNFLNTDVNNFSLTSNLGGGDFQRCKFGRTGTMGSADYGTAISYCKDLTFTDCHFQARIFRTNAAAHVCYVSYSDNIRFIRPVLVGGALVTLASTNNYVEDPVYADSFHTTASATTPPLGAVEFTGGSVDNVLKGGNWWSGIDNMNIDTAMLYLTGATNTRWYSCGASGTPIVGGAANRVLYACNDAGNNIGVELKRIYFDDVGTRFYTSLNSSKGVVLENCAAAYADTNTSFDCLNGLIKGLNAAAADTAFTAVYGTIFHNYFTALTTGRVGITFNEDTAEYSGYVTKTGLTGASGFDSAGALYLYNQNDVIEYEFPYFVKGYTAFSASNVVVAGGSTGNLSVKYKIKTTGDWTADWTAATSANLTGESINEVTGFKLKIQITCDTAGTNYLNSLYFAMTTSAAAQYELYPLDTYTLTLTGLQTGTKVAVLTTATETLLELLTVSGGAVSYTYPDTSVGGGVDLAILSPGYLYQKIAAYTLTAANASIPVVQNVDYGYVESSSETITFNGTTKRIICDVGTTEIDVVGVYSMWVDWALTSSNLRYNSAFSELGGNTIDAGAGTSVPVYGFLINSWRISPDEDDHTLAVSGGIVLVSGGGDPFVDTAGDYVVRINYQQPVQAITVSTGGTVAPSASEMRSAVGLASANLDTQLEAMPTDTENATAVWGMMGALGKSYALMMAEINACQVIRVGACQGATAQTITLDSGASATDDFYNRTTLTIVTGAAAGQNRLINDYDGATKVATLDRALFAVPSAGNFFAIDSRGNVRAASDIRLGKAQGGSASTIVLEVGSSTLDDYYNRVFVLIESGTGAGQSRLISDYDGGTLTATVARDWITAPDDTSIYSILPMGSVKVSEIDDEAVTAISDAVWDDIPSGLLTVNKFIGLK